MRTKSIVGALTLCALSICAFGVASASAVENGLTAVTCEDVGAGKGKFAAEHCETPETAGGKYDTVAVPEKKATNVVSTGENPKLTAVVKLVNTIITCEKSVGTGNVTNTKDEAGEHRAHGTEVIVNYENNCKVKLKSNETKTCVVEGGKITTNKLTSTTEKDHKVKFSPEGATPFAKFTIGAGECGLTGTEVEVTGKVIGIANTTKHHHVTFEEATNGGELKANGGKASYTGTEVGYMDEGPGQPHGKTVGLTTF